MSKQPNILLVMADQLAAQALSLYGNGVCKTPNLERLAATGAVFTNNYSNNPLCVPSRASMLTGRLSPDIEVYDNANEIASSTPTMAHFMRAQGYQTFLCGKMHFIGPDQLHGFEERLTTDVYPADFQWIADWSAGPAFVPSGTALNGVVEAGPCIRTMQEDYDDDVAYQANRKIYDLARSADERPFFGVVSFTSPHTPFTVSQRYWDLYDHTDIDSPAVPEIPFAELDYFSKALFFAHGRHRHSVTDDHRLNARHAYYAMISYLDEKVGQLLDQLDETGLRDDTMIVFTSDHGEMMGERGMWFKQCFWEWSARVPLIISHPQAAQNIQIEANCSLVDLLPTFIDLGSIDTGDSDTGYSDPGYSDPGYSDPGYSDPGYSDPGYSDPGGTNKGPMAPAISELAGHSLLPLLAGETGKWSDCVIADYLAIGPCVPCRMVKKGPYKYIFTHGQPDLLFDLEADPDELVNLAEEAMHSAQLADLKTIAMNDYDPDLLMAKIIASQRRRRVIATVPGKNPKWDYVAFQGDADRYVRRDGVDATKSRQRLPRSVSIPPDLPELSLATVERMMRGEIDFS